MIHEFKLYIHPDGSVEIIDSETDKRCLTDSEAVLSLELIGTLDEEGMI